MELEAVVYSQDPFAYGCMDSYSVAGGGGAWDYDFECQDKTFHGILESNSIEQEGLHASWDSPSPPLMQQEKEWDRNLSSPGTCNGDQSIQGILFPSIMEPAPVTATNRRKRRRTKSSKNKEEIENQRMTHIAVERNRRKQMNEYLAVLRSLMPPSYVQRVCTYMCLYISSPFLQISIIFYLFAKFNFSWKFTNVYYTVPSN